MWHPPGRGTALGRGLLAVSPRSVLPWKTAQWSQSRVTDTPSAQRLKHPSRSLTCKETRVSCGFTQTTFSYNPDLLNIRRAQRADTYVHSGIGFAHRTWSSGPHATPGQGRWRQHGQSSQWGCVHCPSMTIRSRARRQGQTGLTPLRCTRSLNPSTQRLECDSSDAATH